jgi:hypothetical protein
MTAGPAACAPAPMVVKIPPSMVPKPMPVKAGQPKTRRNGGPVDDGAVHPRGWRVTSCLKPLRNAKRLGAFRA